MTERGAADLTFTALTRGSAKTASFVVRVLFPRNSTWEYQSKFTGQMKQGHNFECYLAGEDPKHYAVGNVKGADEAKAASAKYVHNSVWRISKVALEGQADKRYLHAHRFGRSPKYLNTAELAGGDGHSKCVAAQQHGGKYS